MKKVILCYAFTVMLLLVFVVNILTTSAGGYCPTWVKTSEDTPEAEVFAAGEVFEASTFDVTAGVSSDVYVEKLKVRIRGGFQAKNVEKIYLEDDNGTIYGATTKLGKKGTGFLVLDEPFLIEKDSTEKLHLFLQSKSSIRSGGGLTLGLLDLYGSQDEDDLVSSVYCSAYGELNDSVWGTLHSIVFLSN